MLDFQKNLNDEQKKKLNKMISDWVANGIEWIFG